MALQLTYPGGTLPVKLDSISYADRIDDRGTCNFEVDDLVGYSISQGQWVTVTDSATATTLFTGYIEKIDNETFKFSSGQGIKIGVSCKDQRWLAEKRVYTGEEFEGWTAGDAVCEAHRSILSSEGVQGAYAMRHDKDTTSFGQGTLTGLSSSNNALRLTPSGADKVKTYQIDTEFKVGTYNNTLTPAYDTNNNKVILSRVNAIKYQATAGANFENNPLNCYWKIWEGTCTLAANDHIYVNQFIDSRSPEIKAGIDFLFSDGTWMHDYSTDFQDQYVIPLDASTDLKGWADDQWMNRLCVVQASRAGKVIKAAYLVFKGTQGGQYTAYFANILVYDSADITLKANIFDDTGQLYWSVKGGSTGYTNASAQKITSHPQSGTWLSNAINIATVGIVKSSVVSWVEIDSKQPDATKGSNPQQIVVRSTIDGGATWQVCENHKALPGLFPGMSTTGLNCQFEITFNIGGPDPSLTPEIDYLNLTIKSAAASSKVDFRDIDLDATTFATGVLSNATAYADGLKVTGQYRNWDDLSIASQTLYGVTGAGSPQQGVDKKYFFLRTDNGLDVRSQFNFAGTWQNFIAEMDVQLVANSGTQQYGLIYRTTYWGNANNTFGYFAYIDPTHIGLGKGSNSATGAWTTLTYANINLEQGAWYRLKVVVNSTGVSDTTHKIFLNDVLLVTSTDNSYNAAGGMGVRFYNGGTTRDSGHFDNFGVVGYAASYQSSGYRTTTALALSGTLDGSRIDWDAYEPSSGNLVIESTVDNGVNWAACTNGGTIPLLVKGYNAAGKNLKIRATMNNGNVNDPIVLSGLAIRVFGAYSATGTRVSPVLALDGAGSIGYSSATWQADTPTGSSATVDASPDNITYTNIATSGDAIPNLTGNGNMLVDDYDTNTAANYTAAFWGAGVNPVFNVDTANSRMAVTSGTNGVLVWSTGPNCKNISVELVTNQSSTGGLVFRYTTPDNCYYVTINDASTGSNPNAARLRKRVTATDTILVDFTALPVTFTRGTYHTLKVTMIGTVINVYFDGALVFTYTDASLAGPGYVGIRHSSANTSYWQSLRAQQLGDSATGKNLYTKITLNATDPTVDPVFNKLVTCVRGPDIMTGNTLKQTNYQYQQKVSGMLDDASSQSKYYWDINKDKKLKFLDKQYSLAPFPLYEADPDFKGVAAVPKLTKASPLYRNKQYIRGAIELVTITEKKIGNGVAQSWPLSYPVNTVTSLTLNDDKQTFGAQGDTGKDFYYTPGETTFSQDSSEKAPTELQEISITYIARKPYTAIAQSTTQQTALAAQDGTTGIVEATEDCQGLMKDAADTLAQARIDQYALLTRDWTFAYYRPGFASGQFVTLFIPSYGLNDVDMLITSVTANITQKSDGNLLYRLNITATEGPPIGSYMRLMQKKLLAS